VALIPLAIIAFGAGMESKVFLAAFAATWPILVQSMYGIRDLEPTQFETARSYRISPIDRVIRVLLPSAVPYIATGVRIASAIALALTVSAELIIGSPGVGQAINVATASGAVELVYALIVVAGLLGWILNVIVRRVEKRLLLWHPSHREVV
jgi:ABC-type nitrate/sulfonate/bicarbonate transport system permease component